MDWKDKQSTRSGVKNTIYEIVYANLPEPTYSEFDCEEKGMSVYNFVYERYGNNYQPAVHAYP